MHILHAYKVCHTEIYGGIPEVIRMLANSRKRGVTSGVLAARSAAGDVISRPGPRPSS
jgi:hypothetical protein